MSENKEEIRYILKFYYKKGKNATQAAKRICDVYGHDAVSVRVAQSWFKRFQSGNVDVKDAPRSGRPITEKVDEILEKVEQDRHISSHDIGKELNIDHKTVLNHLEKAGYKKKLDVWVPYNLTIKNLMDRIFICESLLKRNEIEPFLKRLITGDEKWITLQQSESSKTVIKSEFTSSKVMLCVWWDWKGIVYYELLSPGQMIDSNLYCKQLDKVHQAIEIKRPELINSEGIVFHHDNARSYTSLETHQKLRELS
ncbi:PREDICTED: histone-lysine N-methyltransferase SETMAR-like isoform X2 [Polistes canadensis]|uniref:histone-lysine N-methyltransferase SETMAR-like isoform X2 n=1 Tax=Polistes canadensis TaxID=91411 RepID=UPI000718E1AD|nr:PREDICTED: histone-lysine N-methyltransferase SETMAR-like isoform X2 [Polistes canadensis]